MKVNQVRHRGVRRQYKFIGFMPKDPVLIERTRCLLEQYVVPGARVFLFREPVQPRRPHVNGTVSVLSLNINSLPRKIGLLKAGLSVVKSDVVCLQETLFRTDRSPLLLSGYSVLTMDPDGSVGNRGLVTAVKLESGFLLNRVDTAKKTILVAIASGQRQLAPADNDRPQRANVRIGIVNVYANPWQQHHDLCMAEVRGAVQGLLARNLDDIFVMGDFNRSAAWLRNWQRRANLGQLKRVPFMGVTRFTRNQRKSRYAIDHIFTVRDRPAFAIRRHTDWQFSDHIALSCRFTVAPYVRQAPREKIDGRDWAMTDDLTTAVYWEENAPNAASLGTYVSEGVWQTARESRRVRNGAPKSPFASLAVRNRFAALREIGKNHWDHVDGLMEQVEEENIPLSEQQVAAAMGARRAKEEIRTQLRKQLALERKQQREEHIRKQSEALAAGDGRAVWRLIGQEVPRRGQTLALRGSSSTLVFRGEDGEVDTDPFKALELAAAHFGALCADATGNSRNAAVWEDRLPPAGLLDAEPAHELCDSAFGVDEVLDAVRRLQTAKAPGLDGVPNEALKCAKMVKDAEGKRMPSAFLIRLHEVLNMVWARGVIPDEWNEAVVVPVPKKGDVTDLGNYRGIALMNTTCKLLCAIVAARLETICDDREVIPLEQGGFRRQQEALMQVGVMYEVLGRRRLDKQHTYAAFVDFEKAYDTVPHEALFCKLRGAGIRGRAYRFIVAMYEKPILRVRVNGLTSGPKPVLRGLRQGDPMSPYLFNIFARDILNGVATVDLPRRGEVGNNVNQKAIAGLLFADDLVLFAETHAGVVEGLEKVQAWCETHEMRMNAAKCGVMHVCPKDFVSVPIQGVEVRGAGFVPYTAEYTYLGVPVNDTVDVKVMSNCDMKRMMVGFKRIEEYMTSKKALLLSKIYVARAVLPPAGLYGAELWGTNQGRLEKTRRMVVRALRMAMNMTMVTANSALLWGMRIKDPVLAGRLRMIRASEKWHDQGLWVSELWEPIKPNAAGTAIARVKAWIQRFVVRQMGLDHPQLMRTELERRHLMGQSAKLQPVLDRAHMDNATISGQMHILSVQPTELIPDLSVYWPIFKGYEKVLFRLSTGLFTSAKVLRHVLGAGQEWKDECPLCTAQGDTAFHYLYECPALREERDSCFDVDRMVREVARMCQLARPNVLQRNLDPVDEGDGEKMFTCLSMGGQVVDDGGKWVSPPRFKLHIRARGLNSVGQRMKRLHLFSSFVVKTYHKRLAAFRDLHARIVGNVRPHLMAPADQGLPGPEAAGVLMPRLLVEYGARVG